MKSDTIVIIPTYNECENIANMIQTVFAIEEHQFDLLIIDDNSPDGTAAIVKEQMAHYPERLHIIERAGKLGLGTAYITGFKWSLEQGYDYIIEMDADFSHPPRKLIELQEACATGKGDVAVGSRYLTGVNVVNWPMGRVLVLEAIDLDGVEFKGYAFQIEMKFTAHRMGFKITEVPIVFVNRVLGTSKMNTSIFGEAVFGVIKLRLSTWFNRKKYQRRTGSGGKLIAAGAEETQSSEKTENQDN